MTLVAICFSLLLLFGMPIGYVIGIAGYAGMLQIGGAKYVAMGADRFFAGLNEFTLVAVPFFILAGEIMNRSGITKRIADFAQAIVGHWRGGLAHTNMVAAVFFAGITGTAVAEAAAFGTTLVPAMESQGYKRSFACAVTASGSIIGPTIPPSNLMVIYGAVMGISITGLFAAGLIPGILMCVFGMIVIKLSAKRLALPKSETRPNLRNMWMTFRSSVWALLLPVIILGSMTTGVVTPTEAAGIAVLYAIFVGGVIYRKLSFSKIFDALISTARVTGVIFFIIGTASILGWWLTFEQIPKIIATAIVAMFQTPPVIIGMVVLLLMVFGCFMDIIAILIILAPVLGPVTAAIGIDPLHAGIIFILALNISLMTPPVGLSLFTLSSVTGEKVEAIVKEVWPFILADFVLLAVVTYWPAFALFIPRLFGI